MVKLYRHNYKFTFYNKRWLGERKKMDRNGCQIKVKDEVFGASSKLVSYSISQYFSKERLL